MRDPFSSSASSSQPSSSSASSSSSSILTSISNSSNAQSSSSPLVGSIPHSISPLPLVPSILVRSSRSFFLGLLVATLIAFLHLYWNDWNVTHQTTNVWAQREGRIDGGLRRFQSRPTIPHGMRDMSVLVAQTQMKALMPRKGYSRRDVIDRFHTYAEVEHINEIGLDASSLVPSDSTSWQAMMAQARLSRSPASSSEPISMRTRVARDGATWTQDAAKLLRQAEFNRLAKNKNLVRRARAHPLVGEVGHQYYSQRTLILYQFHSNDAESLSNLEFFIETAVRASHPADYVFIMQQHPLRRINVTALPKLPNNARYIFYPEINPPTKAMGGSTTSSSPSLDSCNGLGTIGWLLNLQHPTPIGTTGRSKPPFVDSTQSEYFIAFGHYGYTMFVDSTMRGPWFPIWIDLDLPERIWFVAYQYHLERHQPEMNIVASTISCQYGLPHVQLGAIMVDEIGWNLIDRNRTNVLQCIPSTKSATYVELALSHTLFNGGSNLGSQMLSYQDIDFRTDHTCLGMVGDPQYDELSGSNLPGLSHYMDPMELVFVKYTQDYKHYKSETFSDWKRWEAERLEYNRRSERYGRRWTESDFRKEEEPKSKGEEERIKGNPVQ